MRFSVERNRANLPLYRNDYPTGPRCRRHRRRAAVLGRIRADISRWPRHIAGQLRRRERQCVSRAWPGRQRTGGRIKSHYLVAMRTDHHRLHRLSRLRCSRRVTPADRGKTGDSNDGARQDICQDVAATHCSHSVCSCTLRSWDRISATPNRCEFTPTW
jgi:hypothetical protein